MKVSHYIQRYFGPSKRGAPERAPVGHEAKNGFHGKHGNSERSFGIVFCVVFSVIGLFPLTNGVVSTGSVRWWSIGVAAAFLMVALVRPVLLKPLNGIWYRFGILLSRIINPLVMGLMFFVVLTPVAVLKRFVGENSFPLKPDAAKDSYWIVTDDSQSAGSMKNQF